MISGLDSLNVGESSNTIFGMASGCFFLIFVIAILLQRKWPLSYNVNLIKICNSNIHKQSTNLGEAFNVSGFDTSSSDSDEDVQEKLRQSKNLYPQCEHFNISNKPAVGTDSSGSSCCSSSSGTERVLRYREQKSIQQHYESNNQNECILVMGQGPFYDESEVKKGKSTNDNMGGLQISLAYDTPTRKLTLHLLQAAEMPSPPTNIEVHIVLWPIKKQRQKSKARQGETTQFMESFIFNKISPEDVGKLGVRLRVYTWERLRRPRLQGQVILSFSRINFDLESNFWLVLEKPSSATFNNWSGDIISLGNSDSTGSSVSIHNQNVPELYLGLSYSGTTGRLSIEVIKGTHFRDSSLNRAPDTYVKLNLVSSTGQEMACSKSSVKRAQPNPLFKETFIFQVALFQLPEVTLMVSVYCRKPIKRKDLLGWFCLGLNSSGEEEFSHWLDMRRNKGEQICRWHVLIEG